MTEHNNLPAIDGNAPLEGGPEAFPLGPPIDTAIQAALRLRLQAWRDLVGPPYEPNPNEIPPYKPGPCKCGNPNCDGDHMQYPENGVA